MAYTIIGSVIQNLAPCVREEYATFKGVNKHAEKLSRNLTAIHAVLKDAEEKQISSESVKNWLKNLTDAAHILDDILDKCSIFSEATRDNKFIKLHPKKLNARRSIGKKMKKVAERIDHIAEERVKFGLNPGMAQDEEWRQTTSVISEPLILGRDEDRQKVVELLLEHASDNEELLPVYSIVGHGGYGKTALAKLVLKDQSVIQHFEEKIWVCVSDNFSKMKILQSIIEHKDGKSPPLSTLELRQKKVQEILQNKTYLLVLDDVWSEDQHNWNEFKSLLKNGNGSKGSSILVTTRLDTVATIVGTHPAHRLEGLSDDDMWSLARHYAFETNGEQRPELVKIGNNIVRKCGGSPLAAKVVGSLLRVKTEEHQWDSIEKSEIWKLYDDAIKSALSLSYYHLKFSLRPCFTFCAVFPKDFEMVKEDLIQLWMANGFISSGGNLEAEHVGNEVWDELYKRSFFQEIKTHEEGKVTFKIHDIYHDIASSIMEEQCVASTAASLTKLSKRVHHISCFNIDEKIKYSKIPFKQVESLRTFLDFYPPKSDLGEFPSITSLRALSTSSFQLSALKKFIHLRYLELYRSDIKILPESICSLRKLQTLKLELCEHLSSIPNQLTQLQDLRHLMIKGCHSLASMPSGIGGLSHLRTLSIFIVGSEAGFGLAELHNLQLGGKLHIKGLEKVSNERDAREANLVGKRELNRLYLSWSSDVDSQGSGTSAEQVLDALEPHIGLKGFGMNGYAGINIPNWMRNTSILEGLVDVILYNCKNCVQLPPLGKLPCLTTLYVSGMRDLKYIDDDLYEIATDEAFPSLKKMTLFDLPNLERVLKSEGVEMLSQLYDLRIQGIPKFELPSLPSVEILYVSWETEDSSESLSETDDGSDSNDDGASFLKEIAGRMQNLKELFIENFHELVVLPDELNSLNSLQELYISCCEALRRIPKCVFEGLNSLRVLSFALCSSLSSLPRSTRNLTCLERLQITFCPNLILPPTMNMLTSLRQVRIFGENRNGMLHNGLEGIPSLQNLYLTSFPSLVSLPDWLGAMTSLQTLEMSGFAQLTSLPANFQQLINLKELRISECPKLVNRCKRETGEDWLKIAHVPKLKMDFESDVKPSACEKMKSLWKKLKQVQRQHHDYYPHEDEFDGMVDER
ncbi:putative disease resistance protein RGA1 [Vicia villosa]|uniref:putative disease resistance protein RGA1 n=1 Tax=Vicia villosa TaxID=3911 RepID=UPI00273C8BE0|nr:putative disease resistance protein RGA1 [Vicia villosa]